MSTSGLEFSIKTTGSSVGPESVAAAIANAQSGSRNILGFAGPVAGAGTDYLTVAATQDATPNMVTPPSLHVRMNNRDCNLGTISATRVTMGAGTTSGVANVQADPPTGCNGIMFGSVQLPASEQRTTYPQTGNQLSTATGQTAPLASALPALGMTSNFASAAQLMGMVFGTTAQGNATGVGQVSNNFTRDGSWCQHVLDGDIAVMEVVMDNGPASRAIGTGLSSNTPGGAGLVEAAALPNDIARLALTGSCGALTLAGNTYQVRYAPEFFANEAGQGQVNPVLPAQTGLATVGAVGVQPVRLTGSFFGNAMELVVPRNAADMPNPKRTAKVVFRYRKANSPLRGPDTAAGGPYQASATTEWFASSITNVATANPADTDDAVMVSGESQQVQVGSEPLIEIVAIIPAGLANTVQAYG
jgi:hypothetical protein